MAKYKISFKKSVAKDLRNIPGADVKRILKRIDKLSENPRAEGCIKLSGQELYRIIYEIRDNELIVIVIKVSHRSCV